MVVPFCNESRIFLRNSNHWRSFSKYMNGSSMNNKKQCIENDLHINIDIADIPDGDKDNNQFEKYESSNSSSLPSQRILIADMEENNCRKKSHLSNDKYERPFSFSYEYGSGNNNSNNGKLYSSPSSIFNQSSPISPTGHNSSSSAPREIPLSWWGSSSTTKLEFGRSSSFDINNSDNNIKKRKKLNHSSLSFYKKYPNAVNIKEFYLLNREGKESCVLDIHRIPTFEVNFEPLPKYSSKLGAETSMTDATAAASNSILDSNFSTSPSSDLIDSDFSLNNHYHRKIEEINSIEKDDQENISYSCNTYDDDIYPGSVNPMIQSDQSPEPSEYSSFFSQSDDNINNESCFTNNSDMQTSSFSYRKELSDKDNRTFDSISSGLSSHSINSPSSSPSPPKEGILTELTESSNLVSLLANVYSDISCTSTKSTLMTGNYPMSINYDYDAWRVHKDS